MVELMQCLELHYQHLKLVDLMKADVYLSS